MKIASGLVRFGFEVPLYTGAGELVILEGPRISRAGTNTSTDNAIRITLDIEVPDTMSQADLLFTIGP